MSKISSAFSVLVIENDHNTRVALRKGIECAGYSVFSAANGEDGLALLARIDPPSIVLLSWSMPLLNGEDFIKAKIKNELLVKVPVVIISPVANDTLPKGAVEIVSDPLDFDTLLGVVEWYCAD